MELFQVRYFLALSKTLNFTRAAEACNVTQPPARSDATACIDSFPPSSATRDAYAP